MGPMTWAHGITPMIMLLYGKREIIPVDLITSENFKNREFSLADSCRSSQRI